MVWESSMRSRRSSRSLDTEVRHPSRSVERRNSVLSRQKLIAWLEEQFSDLCDSLRELPEGSPLSDLHGSLIEGIDSAFLVFLDAIESDDEDAWFFAGQLIGDRRGVMQEIRARYLQAMPEEGGNQQHDVVRATNCVENIFFLLAQLTSELRSEPAA